jgi:hypothetical protein
MSKVETLNSVGYQIEAHWRKCRPKMVAELERQGKLRQAVYTAQELTDRALGNLVERGVPYHEAWKLIGGQWALLPDEQEVQAHYETTVAVGREAATGAR